MFDKSVGAAVAIATGAILVACGSVSGSDPAFWQPAQGFAGAQANLIPSPNAGAAGTPVTPPNGFPPPQGAGGFVGSAGFSSNGGVPPNFGGAPNGAAPPVGGTSFGGAPPNYGTGGDNGAGGFVGGNAGNPPQGTGGQPTPPPTNSGACSFKFSVTTTSYGGHFHPANVGAIYIENSSGTFVKSLNVWGALRLGNLTDWEQASGGNTTDAVTSATRGNAGTISGSWNCTDTSRQPVPDGQYQVCCSFQEDDALPFFGPNPKKACVSFNKGQGPFSTSAPDQQYFTQMSLSMQ